MTLHYTFCSYFVRELQNPQPKIDLPMLLGPGGGSLHHIALKKWTIRQEIGVAFSIPGSGMVFAATQEDIM